MQNIVSDATIKNWNKLQTKNSNKLTRRANKRLSQKSIVPLEYFYDIGNKNKIEALLHIIQNKKDTIQAVLFSVAVNLLQKANLYQKSHVQKVLAEYNCNIIDEIVTYPLPEEEQDILGLIYQILLLEGQKNMTGCYYTPYYVTKNMTKHFCFDNGQTFFDPCCGSGAFFLCLEKVKPQQLYGMDKDRIAVMIAKVNMLLKFHHDEFVPQIYCGDYLKKSTLSKYGILDKKFDYIVTNPPWGAISEQLSDIPEITSKETFSYFFVRSFESIKQCGIIRFLFPESILNVKVHQDIRTFLLQNGCIKEITIYQQMFTGVATKYVDILFQKGEQNKEIIIHNKKQSKKVPIAAFYKTKQKSFCFMDNNDIEIVEQVKNYGKYYLDKSTWALGIVTGDNANKLKNHFFEGSEAIYTGKEIKQYFLKPAKKYILYDKKQLQQSAPEKYYRASEKLVYKFISKKLVFAYDNTKSLFLNSANILIPNIENMSIKTVMAYLNSELFCYLHFKLFGEIKILKGNLCALPFAPITQKHNNDITNIVNDILNGKNNNHDVLQDMIYHSYGLNKKQIKHIQYENNVFINRK